MSESDSDGTRPGPNVSATRERLAEAIRATDRRAITATEIADVADVTVKTAYKHLDTVVAENDDILTQEIGGSQAYWSVQTDDTPRPAAEHSVLYMFAEIGGLAVLWIGVYAFGAAALASAAVAVALGVTIAVWADRRTDAVSFPELVLNRIAAISAATAVVGFLNVVAAIFGQAIFSLRLTLLLFAPTVVVAVGLLAFAAFGGWFGLYLEVHRKKSEVAP